MDIHSFPNDYKPELDVYFIYNIDYKYESFNFAMFLKNELEQYNFSVGIFGGDDRNFIITLALKNKFNSSVIIELNENLDVNKIKYLVKIVSNALEKYKI